ncbi:hypothetical protein [Pseudomonas sp. CLCA07]
MSEELDVLWVKTETGGVTNLSFRRDGTIEKIIDALQRALDHARAELSCPVDCADAAAQNSKSLERMLGRGSASVCSAGPAGTLATSKEHGA